MARVTNSRQQGDVKASTTDQNIEFVKSIIIIGGGPDGDLFYYEAPEMPEGVNTIKPAFDNSKAIEEIPDKANFTRPIQKPNIDTYFPEGNGEWYVLPIRFGGAAGAMYYILHQTTHRTDNMAK